MKDMPKDVKKNLHRQEKVLTKYEDEKNKLSKLTEVLSHISRRDKELLLIRQGENFRIKKEVNQLVEVKKDPRERFAEEFGNNMW